MTYSPGARQEHTVALAAGLDEGLLSLSFSSLLYMDNNHSCKKCQ
jgi:hypothetical protein